MYLVHRNLSFIIEIGLIYLFFNNFIRNYSCIGPETIRILNQSQIISSQGQKHQKVAMQSQKDGNCPFFQVHHSQYTELDQLSEVLEMNSIPSSSSAPSQPEIHLDEAEQERIPKEVQQNQEASTRITNDDKGNEQNVETLLLQIKYDEEKPFPMPQEEKQEMNVEVNLLENSEVQSEQLLCVESIKVQIVKPNIEYNRFFDDGVMNHITESKSHIIQDAYPDRPEKEKKQRACFMPCQKANPHPASPPRKQVEIKQQECKIEEKNHQERFISSEEKVIEEKGKSHKKEKKEFIMACQRMNLKAQQPKKKEKEVPKKKKKEVAQQKLKADPNALQSSPEFQEYFQRCKFQFCGKECRGGYPITMVCVEKNCNEQAQHCVNPQCFICATKHQNCFLKFTYEMFNKSLQRNVMRQKKTMQIVYSTYNNILKEINKNREKTMKFLCVQGVNEGLLKDLQTRYQDKQHISFKGKEVLNAIEMLGVEHDNNQSRESKIYEKLKEDEKMIIQRLQHEMHLLFEPYTICSMNVLDSRLLTNKSQAKYVLEQLDYPKDMKLLYRASEHEFSIRKFHQICDKQDNTFTIIKTEFGKLIGGFTPLKWNNKYGRDRSNRTFMLAISLKEKLEHIKHGESAIYYSDNLGPSFGGLFETKDIEIFSENGVLSCNTSFPSTYNWKKFFISSQQSWRFLTGVQEGKTCRVLDYEVFKVYFRE